MANGAIFDDASVRLIEQVVRRVLTQMQSRPFEERIRPASYKYPIGHHGQASADVEKDANGTVTLHNWRGTGVDKEVSFTNTLGAKISIGDDLFFVETFNALGGPPGSYGYSLVGKLNTANLLSDTVASLADHETRITALEGA